MNKKGFISGETFATPAFWLLTVGGWVAVILGWKWSQSMESGGFSVFELMIILVVIALASAFFTRD